MLRQRPRIAFLAHARSLYPAFNFHWLQWEFLHWGQHSTTEGNSCSPIYFPMSALQIKLDGISQPSQPKINLSLQTSVWTTDQVSKQMLPFYHSSESWIHSGTFQPDLLWASLQQSTGNLYESIGKVLLYWVFKCFSIISRTVHYQDW